MKRYTLPFSGTRNVALSGYNMNIFLQNYCPDLNLSPVQLAESKAYRTMLEEKLLPALRYIW